MPLFGGMFGGGQKHPNLDNLSHSIQNNLGLQIGPPGEDVLAAIDAMTIHDLLDIQNAHSVEIVQDLLMRKSLRASVDLPTQTVLLSVAAREEIESELKTEHTAVKVLHVGGHQGRRESSARLVRPRSPSRWPHPLPSRRRRLSTPKPLPYHPPSSISKRPSGCVRSWSTCSSNTGC